MSSQTPNALASLFLRLRLGPASWLPDYRAIWLRDDIVAGVTLAALESFAAARGLLDVTVEPR